MASKPITPQEAKNELEENFPEFVIDAVNNCIKNNFFGKESFTIKQDVIAEEILKLAPEGTSRDMIFKNHWMDFEDIFRKAGWNVYYDKPGWDENYDAFFKFTIKK